MSTNPIDQNATPKPTGNLEELFRHHLGEEAAVPPRPMLWDQIDNSLLIRQNETYRRRLAATRWVAAASLLLASLAGTGWWVGRDALLTSNGVAGVASPAATRTGADDAATAPAGAGRRTTGATNSANAAAVATNAATGHQGAATSRVPGANAVAVTGTAANTGGRTTGFGPVPAPQNLEGRYSPAARYGGSRRFQTPVTAAAAAATASGLSIASRATQIALTPDNSVSSGEALGHREQLAAVAAASATSGSVATSVATGGVVGSSATTGLAATAPTLAAAAAPTTSALAVEPVGALAARATSLALADAELLPTGLVSEPVPTEAAAAIDAHRWHYSTSYMAGVFNPNINFSRTGIEPTNDYDRRAAFGANSPSLTEAPLPSTATICGPVSASVWLCWPRATSKAIGR